MMEVHPNSWLRTLWAKKWGSGFYRFLKILFKEMLRIQFKIQFYLRDNFLARNTILSAQKVPAGRFSNFKYNLIHPIAPCGMFFQLKIQYYLPKSPLRDDFLTQNTISSSQRVPAVCFSNSKLNFICPKGPCVTFFYDLAIIIFIRSARRL